MVVSGVWDMYFIRGVCILSVSLITGLEKKKTVHTTPNTMDFTLDSSWKCLHEPACAGKLFWFLRNVYIFRRDDTYVGRLRVFSITASALQL